MTYDPNPTVTIGGVNYTSETINSITTFSGRTNVDEQPRAGYGTINLVITDGSYPDIQLNSLAYITIDNSAGVPTRTFTGYVTDVTRSITSWGNTGNAINLAVQVVGPISRLSRVLTASTYEKEFDGDRIWQIIEDFASTSWNEVLPTLTWSGINPAKTWLTYDPSFAGTVDRPGSYEITAYSGGPTNAVSHANAVADSALGVLWEDTSGNVNYSDAASRINDVANIGFLTIDAEYVGANIQARSALGDLINQMTIFYKNGQSVSDSDEPSKAIYGAFDGQKTTLLESGVAAQQQLDLYLTARAYPRQILESATIPLHNPDLPNALRDSLIGAYVGLPISFPDLPSAIYNAPFNGFVEGTRFTVSRKTAEITVLVSEYALSQIEQAWNQVSAAESWNTLSATLTWENAEVVA